MEVSKGKRFGAYLIDTLVVVLLAVIVGIIVVALDKPSLIILAYVIGYAYMFFREQVMSGQSVGHKAMGYKVVREDGTSIKGDFLASFLRNITLLIALPDLVLVIIGKPRLGDMIAKTKVVMA
jgi:uncharacterized RDD family membrane protein YckC